MVIVLELQPAGNWPTWVGNKAESKSTKFHNSANIRTIVDFPASN